MSAVTVIRRLLVEHAALVAIVPQTRIFIGNVPPNTALPAIGLSVVSAVPRNTLSMGEVKRLVVDRVQVTTHAKTYPEKDSVLSLVGIAVKNTRGVIAGVSVRSVIPAGGGPDLDAENPKVFRRSRDYKVSFIE